MNILGLINKTATIGKGLIIVSMFISLVSLVNGIDASVGLTSALTSLCTLAQTFLGIASMLLVVLAGCIYAIGQLLGAETRARATVWATAMLTGSIIGIIIYMLGPFLIRTLLTGAASNDNPCTSPPALT